MRYLVRDSKTQTQICPNMNNSSWYLGETGITLTKQTSDITESKLVVKVNATDGNAHRFIIGGTSTAGHTYYIRAHIVNETQHKSVTPAGLNIGNAQGGAVTQKILRSTASGSPNIRVSYEDAYENDVLSISLECFDLTTDFGAGKEPTTTAECEEFYGSRYKTNGTHYKHIEYCVMNGIDNELEVIG